MGFYQVSKSRPTIDCSNDPVIVEQNHKSEVDINNIVKRHGAAVLAKVAAMKEPSMRYDNVTGNDFQEAMNILIRAKESFMALPAKVRKDFDNDPAKFLDFVQDPNNAQAMIDKGLALKPSQPEPVEVIIKATETPSA